MSRQPGRRPRRSPRVPTWALATGVVAAFVVAGVLFLQPGGDDDRSSSKDADRTETAAEGFLTVPEDDASDDRDRSRRGEAGATRLDAETSDQTDAGAGDDEDSTGDDEELPATYVNLRDVAVVLQPATSIVSDAALAARRTTIDGIRLRCAPAGEASAARRRDEDTVVGALAARLDDAEARIGRPGTDDAPADDCAAARARRLAAGSLALVVAVDAQATRPRVLAGRPVAKADAAASRALAAELAAQLGAGSRVTARSRADLARLSEVGAIDLPRGSAVALVTLPPLPDAASRDERIRQVVDALAAIASRTAG